MMMNSCRPSYVCVLPLAHVVCLVVCDMLVSLSGVHVSGAAGLGLINLPPFSELSSDMSAPFSARQNVGSSNCGGRFYLVGGHDGSKLLQEVWAFDPAANTTAGEGGWTQIQPDSA